MGIRNVFVGLVLVACCAACTGDWNQDSIFFSPRMADERLERQRDELRAAQRNLAEVRAHTTAISTALERAKTSAKADRETLARYRREIANLERTLAGIKANVDGTVASNRSNAEVRHGLSDEAANLQRQIDQMRADLLVLLENA